MEPYDRMEALFGGPAWAKAQVTFVILVVLFATHHLLRYYTGRLVTGLTMRQKYRQVSRTTNILLAILLIMAVWVQELKTISLLLTGLLAAFMVTNKELILGLAGRVGLAVTNQYSLGDRIQVNGVTGDVVNIGLLYTWMLEVGGARGENQSTGKVVSFPHIWLLQTSVVNFTHSHQYVWDEIEFVFPIYSNRREMIALITSLAGGYLKEDILKAAVDMPHLMNDYAAKLPPPTPVCYAHLERQIAGLKRMVITLRFAVAARARRQVHSGLLLHILDELENNGIYLLTDTVLPDDQEQKKTGRKKTKKQIQRPIADQNPYNLHQTVVPNKPKRKPPRRSKPKNNIP
ncbi:MAG: mechanosensitive ion channel [Deltaproteobacteria bacterium]|nr:mechanosensitive ion channel [Deltaproteobacteria bacterium]